MKKKYHVGTTVSYFCNITVEANSSEEAVEIVREMDYDEHNLKAELASMDIEVEPEAFEWEEIEIHGPELSIEDKLRINELERLILFLEKMLINRDYDHGNDDYWDAKYEEIEKIQAEIDEIKKKNPE